MAVVARKRASSWMDRVELIAHPLLLLLSLLPLSSAPPLGPAVAGAPASPPKVRHLAMAPIVIYTS